MTPIQSQPQTPHPHEGKLWHMITVASLAIIVFVLAAMLGYRFYSVQQLIRSSPEIDQQSAPPSVFLGF